MVRGGGARHQLIGDPLRGSLQDETPSFIGRTLAHYVIVDKLGEGGMGVVYRARDERLNRSVALKILPPNIKNDPDQKRRFIQEAKAASALNHPNIVTVYDIGTVDDVSFIAMEHIKGVTLHEAARPSGLPIERVLALGTQIADALVAAHRAGVVHRDLKPGNIMIADGQYVKVLDFGLAKLMEPMAATESDPTRVWDHARTQAGMVVGTVAYMSPEQLEGRAVGPPTDTFSLGCVLYEMVTGQPAFGSHSAVTTIAAVLGRNPAPIGESRTDVPQSLTTLIAACLQKNPAARPALADVKRVLDDLRLSRDVSVALSAMVRRPLTRRGLLRVAAAAVVVALTAAGGWIYWQSRTPAREPLNVLRRITADAGLTGFPALSPDGRLLAYASDRAGNGALNIWVRQVAGGDAIRLTSGDADDIEPSFSPDGSQIVFRSERDGGGIYVISALGGEPRQLAGNGRRPRFSPDGRWIAFRSGTTSNSGEFERVYLIPATGGERIPWHPEFGAARDPVWSLDGHYLLFLGKRDGGRPWPDSADWWMAPVEGGEPQSIGALAALGEQAFVDFTAPEAWVAPNDIVFSWRVGDSTNVWRVSLSRNNTITGPPERLTFGTGMELQPAVLPSGGIVFASYTERLNIWGLATGPARGAAGELQRFTQSDATDGSPSVSVSGQRVAFVSNRAGSDEVWVHDVPSGRDTMLTGVPGRKGLAVLSHDGSRVAFAVVDTDKYAIYTADSSGGLVTRVCDDCGQPRSWTIDNQQVLYQARQSKHSRFLLLDVASKRSTVVLEDPERDLFSGSVSADGQWIAFHAKRPGADGQQVFVAPLRASGVGPDEWIPLTSGEFEDDKPRWSAEGAAVYLTSVRDGFRCVWVAQVDPVTKRPLGDVRPFRHFHQARLSMMYPALGRFDLAVARDKIIFTLVERTANLWMATSEARAR